MMRIQASVGRGAKKTDSIRTRVGKLTLTAQIAGLPFNEYGLLARLCRQIDDHGVNHVVEAAENAKQKGKSK